MTLTPVVWVDEVTHHYRPRMFTREAWAALSTNQRDLIRRQRMAVVAQLEETHWIRYHGGTPGQHHAADLAEALQQ